MAAEIDKPCKLRTVKYINLSTSNGQMSTIEATQLVYYYYYYYYCRRQRWLTADRWRRVAAADSECRCSSSGCRLPINTHMSDVSSTHSTSHQSTCSLRGWCSLTRVHRRDVETVSCELWWCQWNGMTVTCGSSWLDDTTWRLETTFYIASSGRSHSRSAITTTSTWRVMTLSCSR